MLEKLVAEFVSGVWAFAFAAALCTVVEVIFVGERQTWRSRLRGFCFWAIFIAAATLAGLLTAEIIRGLGIRPLLRIDLSSARDSDHWLVWFLGYTALPFTGYFIFDFCYYFFHRLQHSVPFLWRFHAVHHSIEELNAFNSYHHWLEEFIRIPLMTIPISILVGLGVQQIAVSAAIMVIATHLSHANTTLGFGPIRYFLAEPRYHRIHHSIEQRHWDKNFAFNFPILDVLFGTAYFPTSNEFPRTGVSHMREPKTVRQYLFPPAPERAGSTAEADGEQRRDLA